MNIQPQPANPPPKSTIDKETKPKKATVKKTEPKRNVSRFTSENQPEGRGRPPGTTNKLSVKSLLAQLSTTVGKPFEQQLAENYREAIVAEDRKLIHAYDNLFLSKLLADKVDLTVDNNTELLDSKREAFMAAMAAYGQTVMMEQAAITVDATVVNSGTTIDGQ